MARHWVKFNVFFETLEDDDDELFDQIVTAVSAIVDPACAGLDWDALGGNPPPGHRCTRDWTAGSCSIPALPDDAADAEVEMQLDTIDEALCSSCGRPFPDATHRVEHFRVGEAVPKQ